MARKLRSFVTSSGFFDLAIAAPSMKAALRAWGTKTNLFSRGFAKEVSDPDVVAATMAKPGIVLRRAVGSNNVFKEKAELPAHIIGTTPSKRPSKGNLAERSTDEVAERKAALAFEREERRRAEARKKEESAQDKRRSRRTKAIAAAESALEKAARAHEARVKKLAADRSAVERRLNAENKRWEDQRGRLETALRRAQRSEIA
jgi:colicin import membrane protein